MVLRSGLCVGMAGLWLVGCGCGGGDSGPRTGLGCDPGQDVDGDGYCANESEPSQRDCDDTDRSVHPGSTAVETCMDANCDGIGGPDTDADGHDAEGCPGGDDCDDGNADAYPGALDTVGVGGDQDCDGLDGVDADRDLHASEASGGDDCNDADASIYPGATDDFGDGTDQNCSGADGVDRDADGYPDADQGGTDCDDRVETTHPDAVDQYGDGVDANCDGPDGVDADGDGSAADDFGGTDCNDANANIHPFSQGDWTWEILSEAMRGDPPSAALATDDSARVAFIEENDIGVREVVLGSNEGGAWSYETVAPSNDCVALALDVDDAAHVVYRDGEGTPQYARLSGGAWVSEAIAGGNAVGLCNVDVAEDGAIGTAFSTADGALTYAARPAGGDFASVTLDLIATTDVSFAFDSSGGAHIAFSDAGGVHYASEAGDWEIFDVGDGGTSPSLALSGLDPRIAYRGDQVAEYATIVDSEWAPVALSDQGVSPHLALDGNDVHIVFGNEDPVDPSIANVLWYWSTGGVFWESAPVPPVERTERWARILVTSDHVPLFFVVRDPPDAGDPQTLYFVKQAPRNNVDDDCDGRVW